MSYATVHSCTLSGVKALPVTVEVHISGGLPGTSIVGLPQSTVRESKDRVKAAIQHIGLTYPQVRIIVNLAPADLPKRGGRFDLPIALGILKASGQLPTQSLDDLMVLGELGLTGELRPVTGILPTAHALADSHYALYIPRLNVEEALRSTRTRVHGVDSLQEACDQLLRRHRVPLVASVRASDESSGFSGFNGSDKLLDTQKAGLSLPVSQEAGVLPGTESCDRVALEARVTAVEDGESLKGKAVSRVDMSDVFGQHKARRALEIAAAGAHNLLMVGSPGTGKSMLACRLPGIQPPMSEAEAMETASVQSISHSGFDPVNWGVRPFRSPHHTASGVALVGGGSNPMPGEISLAHHGVLFLDELTEFSRSVLDVLREPMETGKIIVSRAARQAEFPSRFQLVAAMNPCPCGFYNDVKTRCTCGLDQIIRYQSRVSGPLLDRIDLHLDMQREQNIDGALGDCTVNESTEAIRARVVAARERQLARQQTCNAALEPAAIRRFSALDRQAQILLRQASENLNLSLRAQHRLVRVSRTIADLGGCENVMCEHLTECLSYRRSPVLNTI